MQKHFVIVILFNICNNSWGRNYSNFPNTKTEFLGGRGREEKQYILPFCKQASSLWRGTEVVISGWIFVFFQSKGREWVILSQVQLDRSHWRRLVDLTWVTCPFLKQSLQSTEGERYDWLAQWDMRPLNQTHALVLFLILRGICLVCHSKKAWVTKEKKTDKLNYITVKNFCASVSKK